MTAPRVLFALEQVLGHVSQSQNFKRFLPEFTDIDPVFADVTFHHEDGAIERLPLPGAMTASMRARMEVTAAMHDGLPAAFFFNTQKVALFCPDLVARRPSLMSLDVTPVQYDAMAGAYGHVPDGRGPVARAKHVWNRRVFRSARRLIPASNWVAESLVDDYGLDPARITVIPPGVDTSRWTPRCASGEVDGPVRILFVGGNFDRKGGRLLLDWHGSSLDAEGCELHIVTRDAVESRPGVHVYYDMQNNSDDLVRLAQSCDLFVLPTTADCFSLASMEAMAAGLPAITTNVGGIPDIVEDGVSGYLIAPNDGAALARAISAAIADRGRLRAMGQAARTRIEQRFDARKNTRRVVDAIVEVIAQAN